MVPCSYSFNKTKMNVCKSRSCLDGLCSILSCSRMAMAYYHQNSLYLCMVPVLRIHCICVTAPILCFPPSVLRIIVIQIDIISRKLTQILLIDVYLITGTKKSYSCQNTKTMLHGINKKMFWCSAEIMQVVRRSTLFCTTNCGFWVANHTFLWLVSTWGCLDSFLCGCDHQPRTRNTFHRHTGEHCNHLDRNRQGLK